MKNQKEEVTISSKVQTALNMAAWCVCVRDTPDKVDP